MSIEKWVVWEPLVGISGVVHLNLLSDINDELKIDLTIAGNGNSRRSLQVLFKNSVLFYQNCDETTKLSMIGDLDEIKPVFRVINSTLIHSLVSECDDTTLLDKAMHFTILELDSVIDIVATHEPTVTWV